MTQEGAEKLLNLSSLHEYTIKEIRNAYFTAAKLCHPDCSSSSSNNNKDDDDNVEQFLNVTEAYELLLSIKTNNNGTSSSSSSAVLEEEEEGVVSQAEELQFIKACEEWLGLPAEIVEESKKCPLFRQWLQGRTDGAIAWSQFLTMNGGLAPKLRFPSSSGVGGGILEEGQSSSSGAIRNLPRIRRKRRK